MSEADPMVQIVGNGILLRDALPADALWDFRWATVETAWLDWDAPWEGAAVRAVETFSVEDIERYLSQRFADIAAPLATPRPGFRVDLVSGLPLGVVNQYHRDPEARSTYAGIGIRESAYWGRGLGTEAFRLWIGYLFTHYDLARVRTATWSGNTRMVRVAEKCGFTLLSRNPRSRQVRGEWYDGLEFMLVREDWDGWTGEAR